jgi:D-arabinose 1-dehydrogenase-like Zn-dependent alcohol dehydrogenase
VKTEPLARIPDGVTDEQAAALPIAGIAALRSLDLLSATASQCLVVMGATGGVGGYAVQMARARRVRVIATVRGDVEEARCLGADEVYNTETVEAVDALRAAHPDGVDGAALRHTTSRRIRIPYRRRKGWGRLHVCSRTAKITARIGSRFELDKADQMLEKLRHGGLRGKTVIRL